VPALSRGHDVVERLVDGGDVGQDPDDAVSGEPLE
jgi:hypothetical protein